MPRQTRARCAECGKARAQCHTRPGDRPRCQFCGAVMPEESAIRGHLYILSNPTMPGLLKIGLTTRPVIERAAELGAATGVAGAFRVEAYFESSDLEADEKAAHKRLARNRVRGKEFFKVSLDEAIDVLRGVTGRIPLGQVRHLTPDERFLCSLRDQILASGRDVPDIWRCAACSYSFFEGPATGQCPRCGHRSK